MGLFKKLLKPNIDSMENKKNFEGLFAALTHDDNEVKREAVKALGRLGDVRAVDPLIKILNDTDSTVSLYVRGDAARALGDIKDKKAVVSLQKAAQRQFMGIGSFKSLEEAARYAAERKKKMEYFEKSVKDALEMFNAL